MAMEYLKQAWVVDYKRFDGYLDIMLYYSKQSSTHPVLDLLKQTSKDVD
jgi:hypothetical protein